MLSVSEAVDSAILHVETRQLRLIGALEVGEVLPVAKGRVGFIFKVWVLDDRC